MPDTDLRAGVIQVIWGTLAAPILASRHPTGYVLTVFSSWSYASPAPIGHGC